MDNDKQFYWITEYGPFRSYWRPKEDTLGKALPIVSLTSHRSSETVGTVGGSVKPGWFGLSLSSFGSWGRLWRLKDWACWGKDSWTRGRERDKRLGKYSYLGFLSPPLKINLKINLVIGIGIFINSPLYCNCIQHFGSISKRYEGSLTSPEL